MSEVLDSMDFPLALCPSLLKGDRTVGKWWEMITWLSKQKPILLYSSQPCEDTLFTEELRLREHFFGVSLVVKAEPGLKTTAGKQRTESARSGSTTVPTLFLP